MSSPTKAFEKLGADYRAAKAGVIAALQRQADAELEAHHSGKNGAAVAKAVADVEWCRALVVACGELLKDATFKDLLRPEEIAADARRRLLQERT